MTALEVPFIRDLKRVCKVKFGLQRVSGARVNKFQLFALDSNLILSSETIQAGGFVSGLISGASTRIAKELFLHPLDTIRARQQTKPLINTNLNESSLWSVPVSRLYDGIFPALLSGVPSGAIFFAVKDSTSSVLRSFGITRDISTIASVCVANIPYWLIRAPAEV